MSDIEARLQRPRQGIPASSITGVLKGEGEANPFPGLPPLGQREGTESWTGRRRQLYALRSSWPLLRLPIAAPLSVSVPRPRVYIGILARNFQPGWIEFRPLEVSLVDSSPEPLYPLGTAVLAGV